MQSEEGSQLGGKKEGSVKRRRRTLDRINLAGNFSKEQFLSQAALSKGIGSPSAAARAASLHSLPVEGRPGNALDRVEWKDPVRG